ncbi:hypothetical protein PVL30_005223 [Lodderomyces elongisporus]|uniref:uncharacterized protein n=1 Tax=Lodderomyces elongisporus TaxID=36914 RepID=UPI00291CB8B6|nr:uncharacterized protein PVL30_005223 [Lodderomyces elongisporus]WLF81426.1 hypothetical protein PVL30_005223 [Lodderomyces elongisporus]
MTTTEKVHPVCNKTQQYINLIEKQLCTRLNNPIAACTILIAYTLTSHLTPHLPQLSYLVKSPYPESYPFQDILNQIITIYFVYRFAHATKLGTFGECLLFIIGALVTIYVCCAMELWISISLIIQLSLIAISLGIDYCCARGEEDGDANASLTANAKQTPVRLTTFNNHMLKIPLSYSFLMIAESDDAIIVKLAQWSIKLYCLWIMILWELKDGEDLNNNFREYNDLETQHPYNQMNTNSNDDDDEYDHCETRRQPLKFRDFILVLTCIGIIHIDVYYLNHYK